MVICNAHVRFHFEYASVVCSPSSSDIYQVNTETFWDLCVETKIKESKIGLSVIEERWKILGLELLVRHVDKYSRDVYD